MRPVMLIIDDSLTVRKIMEATAQRAGWFPFSCRTGEQALEALANGSLPHPAAILVDLTLPGLDGYAVIHALRQMEGLAQAIIILLSGRTGWLDRYVRGRLAGANAYVTKPFQPQQVLAMLREQLARRS